MPNPKPHGVGLLPAARRVHADILGAFRSRRMLAAMLLLISPVGPGAAANLFSAIAPEYRMSSQATILLAGFSGSLLTALGCLAGGVIADRVNRWKAMLSGGLVIGMAALVNAVAPRTATAFLVGVTSCLLLSGVVNAAYTALILEAIGRSARSAGAQYTWLNNLGNLPVAYMTWLDGQGHRLWGAAGLFAVDGIGNVIPILLLFLVVARSCVAISTDRRREAAAGQ